ncbi:phosphoadenosine phosphosulfate reductase domain-containing protein [Desertibacillus haloalkaliphilus]|uniref:phosphoadenosine phosphosulfate reductase domain-containing protein n=1 Tax=Desertibacillus haloalkaliphilus TaxID=1328930 RepID=UPI001C25B4CA|nr:phosphoadenosine phosphosulfate reductase family protein [Desertibacillus haloalkaliphilus]MBU8908156.1 phosphoadenosine phosphosulfate reductase family protein [Desertibacillus haloalkaliphilus]
MDKIQVIKEHLREIYLLDKKEWMLMISYGKDSSFLATLVCEMLEDLPTHQRNKKVHFITSDTLAETPMMSDFVRRSNQSVNDYAMANKLPMVGHLVYPDVENDYFYQTLAKGNPTPVSNLGRWCTSRLKQKPTQQKIQEILSQLDRSVEMVELNGEVDEYDCYMLLGVREEESARRKSSIEKHQIDDSFSRHSDYPNQIRVYNPIRFVTSDELWFYLAERHIFPWGIEVQDMQIQYGENFLECGIQHSSQQESSCGSKNSRSGCWTCSMVKKDKMLYQLIDEGYSDMEYLLEWKETMMQLRNDIRYREPVKRNKVKQQQKRLNHQRDNQHMDLFSSVVDTNVSHYFENKKLREYDTYDRANDTEYEPGSLAIQGRKLMLQKLLYIQEVIGQTLIRDEVVHAIIETWQDEGYNLSLEDCPAQDFTYDGALVLEGDGSLNIRETTNPYPVFTLNRDFSQGRDELIEYLNDRKKKKNESIYYFLSNVDMGEKEQFAWNVGIFVICHRDIQTEEQANQYLDDWIYEPQVPNEPPMDWDAFAKRYYDAARELVKDPEYDIESLQKINQILVTLGYETVKPYRKDNDMDYCVDLLEII